MNTDLAERCRRIPVGVLNDVLVKAGAPHQVLSHEIRAHDGMPPFAGPAFCVRGERTMGGPGQTDLRFEMYRRFRSDSVLVIGSGAFRPSGTIGENMTAALKVKGCIGVVTDGGYRDREGIAALGVPVRAAFVSPVNSGGNYAIVAFDVAVTLPGQTTLAVTVSPGDMIVSDGDGTVVIPAEAVNSVVEDAEAVLLIEDRTRELILAGTDAEAAYGTNPRFKHVRLI